MNCAKVDDIECQRKLPKTDETEQMYMFCEECVKKGRKL